MALAIIRAGVEARGIPVYDTLAAHCMHCTASVSVDFGVRPSHATIHDMLAVSVMHTPIAELSIDAYATNNETVFVLHYATPVVYLQKPK